MENNDKLKTNIHNAGVGGSSPPITTISHKAFSKFQQTVNPIGITLGLHIDIIIEYNKIIATKAFMAH